jgi:hypothetical protein
MKNIHNLLKTASPDVKVTTADGIDTLTNVPVIGIKRNELDFNLAVLSMEKGKEKGNHYYGIEITEANISDRCKQIGNGICANFLHTAVNTKMQTFNETALLNVKGDKQPSIDAWNKLTPVEQFNKFKAELVKIVEAWSMRELSVKKIYDEMGEIGVKLATATAEEKVVLMARLTELAMLSASK